MAADNDTRVIEAPDAGPMPSVCSGMSKAAVWAYAHLCGYRAALAERQSALAAAPMEPAGVQQVAAVPDAQPFWHAVVSDEAPGINKAIRRADVAEEYAQNCRENGYRRVTVVPLYTAPPAPQPAARMPQELQRRIDAALECGALWAEKSEGHPRIISALAAFREWAGITRPEATVVIAIASSLPVPGGRLPTAADLRAWAGEPAGGGFVPVHPTTLLALAALVERAAPQRQDATAVPAGAGLDPDEPSELDIEHQFSRGTNG